MPVPVAPPHDSPTREIDYLRRRNLQLQNDITDLTAENDRLRQVVERLHGRTTRTPPNPLGSGQ